MIRATFIPIPSRPFVTLDADLTQPGLMHDEDQALSNLGVWLADGLNGYREPIVRVRYEATEEQARRIDTRALRAALEDAGACYVKVEPRIIRAERARVAGLDESLDELAALDLWIQAEGLNGAQAERLRDRTRLYLEAVRG